MQDSNKNHIVYVHTIISRNSTQLYEMIIKSSIDLIKDPDMNVLFLF